MKKLITVVFVATSLIFWLNGYAQTNLLAHSAVAESMASGGDHTAQEEAEGKAVWEKLQAKQITCADLSDDNFAALGEYFMGRMADNSHEAMNNMMIQMMGEKGEEQMHAVMGKRLSGCDVSAVYPAQGVGFLPMIQMMMGGWSFDSAQDRSSPFELSPTNNSMMNFGYGFGIFGWLFMLLLWVLIIVAVVVLVKWLVNQFKSGVSHKTALDILKERYARGEIDRKEFEDKKKDLV